MMIDPPVDPPDAVSPVEALLELPRSAGEDPLADFLITAADTICRTAGFATAVVNLFRPEWDDYEVVLVSGGDGESVLAGTTVARSAFRRIFAEAEQPLPGLFFLPEDSELWSDLDSVYTPPATAGEHPDAWRAGDGLVAFLADSAGSPLAFLSMDEPTSGRRPGAGDLRFVHAIAAHIAQALESARRREEAAEHARMLSLLLESSPALAACTEPAELLARAGEIVVPALGFERYAAYARRGPGLTLHATAGWPDPAALPARLDSAAIDELLAPVRAQAGCFLGAAAELLPGGPEEPRSARNGRGAAAWWDHCLAVPCRDADGELLGLVVIEDPIDRRLPSLERRRAVRLLVDQVTGTLALQRARRGEGPTTLVPSPRAPVPFGSRRGAPPRRRVVDDVVAIHREVALLVCRLDRLGEAHEVAEQVLAQLGELLCELVRATDVPLRLDDGSYHVILPGTDRNGADGAAARLRHAASTRLAELVPGASLAVEVASAATGVVDVRGLPAPG